VGRKRIYKEGGQTENIYLATAIRNKLKIRKGTLSEQINTIIAKHLKVEL